MTWLSKISEILKRPKIIMEQAATELGGTIKTGISPITPVGIPTKLLTIPSKIITTIFPIIKKRPLLTAAATLLGIGALKVPEVKEYAIETAKHLPELPARIIGTGELLGEAAVGREDVSIKEAALGAGIVGAAVAAGIITVKAIPKVTEFIEKRRIEPEPEKQLITEKPLGIEEVPITPEITTITVGKKPYKRRRAKITPSVRQYVRVDVKATGGTGIRQSHKYINQRLLLN